MVCLGSVRAGGEGESEDVKWGSLMMTRLDIARQTVSSCLHGEPGSAHTWGELRAPGHPLIVEELLALLGSYVTRAIDPSDPLQTLEVVLGIWAAVYTHRRRLNPQSSRLDCSLLTPLFSGPAASKAEGVALPAGKKAALPFSFCFLTLRNSYADCPNSEASVSTGARLLMFQLNSELILKFKFRDRHPDLLTSYSSVRSLKFTNQNLLNILPVLFLSKNWTKLHI